MGNAQENNGGAQNTQACQEKRKAVSIPPRNEQRTWLHLLGLLQVLLDSIALGGCTVSSVVASMMDPVIFGIAVLRLALCADALGGKQVVQPLDGLAILLQGEAVHAVVLLGAHAVHGSGVHGLPHEVLLVLKGGQQVAAAAP